MFLVYVAWETNIFYWFLLCKYLAPYRLPIKFYGGAIKISYNTDWAEWATEAMGILGFWEFYHS